MPVPDGIPRGWPDDRASMSCCVEGRRRMRTSGPTRARRLRLNGYRSSEHPTAVAKPPFDLIGVPRVAPTYPIAKPAFLAGPADNVGAGASDQVTVVPWPCWGSSAQCPIGVAAPHSCRPEFKNVIEERLFGQRRGLFPKLPGNTADVSTLDPGDRLHRRFAIAHVCVVADRGMISADTMAGLRPFGRPRQGQDCPMPSWRKPRSGL